MGLFVLGLLLTVLFVVWGGIALFLSIAFIQVLIVDASVLPPGIEQGVYTALGAQTLVWLVFFIGLMAFSVGLYRRYIVLPLRQMIAGIAAFAAGTAKMTFTDMDAVSPEVRALGSALMNFAATVEQAHSRDTEVSRVKSDFISTAAHQLRTPLTGIRWALEALDKENLTPTQHALVASATEKSHQLVSIVGTLLDISAVESGKYKYVFGPVDMLHLLKEVIEDFTEMAARSQVAVFITSGTVQVPAVRADRERIKWVLSNIVENAVRYTPAGGTVQLGLALGPGIVFIHVRDTGIGIEPKDRSNIFERFYRAENAIAKENAGNGLGLYIARTIATDHGGDLNFKENTDGPGTTFTLSLPIAA